MAEFSQFTAIIPTLSNTQGLALLIKELGQIRGLKVIVIDNLPNPERGALLHKKKGLYLPQQKNLGFAEAVNLGVTQATTEWVLILNDDIEDVTAQLLSRLTNKAEKEKWVAVSPVLTNRQGSVENIGYRVLPIGRVELNFDPKRNSSKHLDGLTAACLLIKKQVFDSVGGFDISFFAYLEDVDLFLILKSLGYTFGVDVESGVIHNHLTTSKTKKSFKEKQDLINWWRIYRKHKQVKFSPAFLLERGRNVSGFCKKVFNYGKIEA